MKKGRRKKKILKAAGVVIVILALYFFAGSSGNPAEMKWGITFSKTQAEGLGLDWKETYDAILNDLNVDNIRLSAYWNEIEQIEGRYDFTILDYQIEEAEKRGVKIILAVGRRLPRWPECHIPQWARDLPMDEQNEKVLENTRRVVERYKDSEHITMWQVENEFFLTGFGECEDVENGFLDAEIALVRSLDARPILITDSGELGDWARSMKRGDVFGTTMYRRIYNDLFGYATYPLAPHYYKRRFALFNPFFRADRIVNVELQAEPWSRSNRLTEDSVEEWNITMSPEQFRKNIKYAVDSKIDLAFLWGAEWWYYAKEERDIDDYWEIAGELWRNSK